MQPVINKKWYGKCLEIVLKIRFHNILRKIINVRECSSKTMKRFNCLDREGIRYTAFVIVFGL